MTACDDCLRRTDLIAALAGRIDVEWHTGRRRPRVLSLPDADLLEWAADPEAAARHARFAAAPARERLDAAGLAAVCRCGPEYPEPLRALPDPPAVLHVLGDPAALHPAAAVAVVGARRASAYGLEVARSLGRGLAACGVQVVSGMALGIDSAGHAGALEAGAAPSVAVLAGAAERPYPARHRLLHRRIAERGAVVSEMPPGFGGYRWCFPARNRIIAALAAVTVVVEATERSGSLITADFATDLGRTVAAVPGPVTTRLGGGANLLLKAGAELVRDAADVLELLFGPDARLAMAQPDDRAGLTPELRRLLDRIERGRDTVAALAGGADETERVLRGLGELELAGLVRRTFAGRYVRTAGP